MITAALSWHDEHPVFLQRCIRSLHRVVRTVVAIDGAWAGPHAHHQPEWPVSLGWAKIKEAADQAQVRLIDHRSPGTWATQQDKRTALMQLAAQAGQPWVLVIDADEWIKTWDDQLHHALHDTDLDVGMVMLSLPPHSRGYTGGVRRLYRASTSPRVERAHNGYVTSDGRWLHGDSAYVRIERAVDLTHLLTLGHQHRSRSQARNLVDIDYRRWRHKTKGEQWAKDRTP